MKKHILLIFIFIYYFGFSQKYPQTDFENPLKIPLVLSGTFGELRSNHFHSGLDIKTQGKEGIKIYAPADGYVSRIKVSQWGFGKAIYITHYNGYTTVYAHLQKFEEPIESYVKSIQYKKENYQTGNIFPSEDKFPVKKGDIIGFTGDTGGSGGPHLHFEIRDTATEHIINPMHFGIFPEDTKSPTLQKAKVYALDNNSRINKTSKDVVLNIKNVGDNKYVTNRITANGYIGFGVNAFDRLNGANNKNGIYSLEMNVNGERYYYHDVETFSFAESKFINLLIDYPFYKKFKSRFQKTHKVKANKLSIYSDLLDNGKIYIENGVNYNIEIIAKDFKGNSSTLQIPVKGVANNTTFSAKDTTAYKITAKKFNKFQQENVIIAFPKNTFYKDLFLDFKVENGVAKVHESTIPLDKKFTLTFNVSSYSGAEKEQLYIANVTNKKYPRYVATKKKDTTFYCTTKTLGSYKLLSDKLSPKISLLNFKNEQWLSKAKTLKVKISDIGSGIKNFRATIDGEWVLMEYNHKRGILTYNFNDKKLVGSKHLFKLVVSDNVGNTKNISATFFRK
ncbi:M23 family metallopeptidase [Tenacibaculum aquimarinum]|uniref:M23 family metallopeptidase n=1 Tax=Tenacibaculum aquimarinum TaxID=2910675 RepID=UPI001F0B4A7B|nr:M23 family metallopeptidase [Tenacibaculum aquimarinum]MCH3884961.1 M23 family metallopeptidase [Tenacibaculum aquimarinum]